MQFQLQSQFCEYIYVWFGMDDHKIHSTIQKHIKEMQTPQIYTKPAEASSAAESEYRRKLGQIQVYIFQIQIEELNGEYKYIYIFIFNLSSMVSIQ